MSASSEPLAASSGGAPMLNIANALTMTRLLMVPLFVVLMFLDHPGWRFAAFAVFVLASITDRIDGELARRRNLVTDFGKVVDPIADKALIGAALVVLSLLGDLWWWVTIVILARDWGITALRFAVIRHGVIPASRGGKIKTVLQVVAISAYLFPLPEMLMIGAHVLMGAALVVTVVTGADYVLQAYRRWRGARSGASGPDQAGTFSSESRPQSPPQQP